MTRLLKGLAVCFFGVAAVAMVSRISIARVGFGFPELWTFPSFSSQSEKIKTSEAPYITERDILVEDFESWEKKYPSGYGMGYATIFQTELDLQKGSRVLDVYRPTSIYLLDTPYEKHRLWFDLFTPSSAKDPEGADGISMETNGIISFDFRAPLDIEPCDNFELGISLEGCGKEVYVRLLPFCDTWDANTPSRFNQVNFEETLLNPAGQLQVTVNLSNDLHDGSWHTVLIDLVDAVYRAIIAEGLDTNEWCIERATAVSVTGRTFRLDNIVFKYKRTYDFFDYLDLFEMGPLYAQIFEPYRYLFIADYKGPDIIVFDERGDLNTYDSITGLMLNPGNFMLVQDPNDPNDPVVKYWTALGADPDLFGKNDPKMASLFGRDSFTVDLGLPIFADPKLRFGGSGIQRFIDAGILWWNATIQGYGGEDIQGFHLAPLQLNPYDGMPTYLPAQYAALDAIAALGRHYYPPGLVYMLEGALWNAGLTIWPNIAAFDFTPQTFEDLIMTIEVTNGVNADTITFPITVVNYPVNNNPPVVQNDVKDQVFYVGQKNECIVNFIDPDCFIFSMSSDPLTTHVPGFPISNDYRTDMDSFEWDMKVNNINRFDFGQGVCLNYCYSPVHGLISWMPKFEGAYFFEVFCMDNRDAMAVASFSLITVNQDVQCNHPPIILSKPTETIVIKDGEEFMLHTPDLIVVDTDGDDLYASSNIGIYSFATDGSFIWKFRPRFPGTYTVEIIFFDIRGGYVIMRFQVMVNPWWTY